jgi:hypothetical protein
VSGFVCSVGSVFCVSHAERVRGRVFCVLCRTARGRAGACARGWRWRWAADCREERRAARGRWRGARAGTGERAAGGVRGGGSQTHTHTHTHTQTDYALHTQTDTRLAGSACEGACVPCVHVRERGGRCGGCRPRRTRAGPRCGRGRSTARCAHCLLPASENGCLSVCRSANENNPKTEALSGAGAHLCLWHSRRRWRRRCWPCGGRATRGSGRCAEGSDR